MLYDSIMKSEWHVEIDKKASKKMKLLPKQILENLRLLFQDLKKGPMKGNWPNFQPFRGRKFDYHCHLNKGKPTYVACWKACKISRTIVIYYVGTHEKAPY